MNNVCAKVTSSAFLVQLFILKSSSYECVKKGCEVRIAVWGEVKEMALLTKKISEMLGAAPGVKDFVGMVSSEVWKVNILTRAVQ